jgi:hypothetical protein
VRSYSERLCEPFARHTAHFSGCLSTHRPSTHSRACVGRSPGALHTIVATCRPIDSPPLLSRSSESFDGHTAHHSSCLPAHHLDIIFYTQRIRSITFNYIQGPNGLVLPHSPQNTFPCYWELHVCCPSPHSSALSLLSHCGIIPLYA